MKIYSIKTINGLYTVMAETRCNAINLAMSCIRESIIDIKEIIYNIPTLDKAWEIGYAQWCMAHGEDYKQTNF